MSEINYKGLPKPEKNIDYSKLPAPQKNVAGQTAIVQPVEEKGFFSKALETTADVLSFPFSNIATPIVEGMVNYFSPEKSTVKDIQKDIVQEQSTEIKSNNNQKQPDINNVLKANQKLVDAFKWEVNSDFKTKGIDLTPEELDLETSKKLKKLGYSQQPYSLENPTLIYQRDVAEMSVEEIEKERANAAQKYNNNLEELQNELPLWGLTGNFETFNKLLPYGVEQQVRQTKNLISTVSDQKELIDEYYKDALNQQTNKYTKNNNGKKDGFLSTQITPKDFIVNPEFSNALLDYNYKSLFSEGEIAKAFANPQEREKFKKQLVEKSVFLNNDFKENALVELKAMEESSIIPDIFDNKLGLVSDKYLRGYTDKDFQYHLAQQIKREKDPLISSLKENEAYKEFTDATIKDYLKNKKTGKSLNIDGKVLDEKWFNESLKTSQWLDEIISNQKNELDFYNDIELNDTKEYRQFQKNQEIFNYTGDKSRTVFSVLDNVKDLARSGEFINDFLYLAKNKFFNEDTVEFRGKTLKSKDIVATKLTKPLRETEQYYELIPKIGDSDQRVKSTEAEGIRIFDDKGNFSPDMDFAVLAGTSVKVGGHSAILGLAGVGGAALAEGVFGRTTGAKLIANSLGKNLALQTGRKLTEIGVGYILPTNMLLGSESIRRYMKKGYNADDSFALSAIDNTIESLTEAISPNDALIVKNLISKGTIKTAEELYENEVYKKAFKKSYKEWTGKNLTEKVYNTLKAYTPSAKYATGVLLEETGEEIYGEGLKSLAYKSGLSKKNPILDEPGNFTADNLANIAVSTMATMLWTGGQSFKQDLQQRQQSQNEYRYLVGQSPEQYVKATVDMVSENLISKEEGERRINEISRLNDNYQKSVDFAKNSQNYKGLKDTEKEAFHQKAFNTYSKKSELEKEFLSAVTEEDKERIVSMLDNTNIELNDLNRGLYKSEEDRAERNILSTQYFINPESVKSFNDNKQINNLINQYTNWKDNETNEKIIESYQNAIDLLQKRKTEVVDKTIEEAKTPEQKAQENNQKGVIVIPTKKGNLSFKIGETYLVNRTLSFDGKEPIKFPEVKFLGYETDEQGNVVTKDNVPVVKFMSEGKEYKAPISYFEDYTLGSKNAIQKSDTADFYNKFKNKRFNLSLKDNKNNFLAKRKEFKDINQDSIDGVLSFEDGEIYFNFINPNTGKPSFTKLSASDVKQYEKYKENAFLKPKRRTYKGTIQSGFENTSAEELYQNELFDEEEVKEYEQWLNNKKFAEENVKIEALRQRRLGYLQDYILKITKKVTSTEQKLEKVNDKIEKIQSLVPILKEIAKRIPFTKNTEIKKILTTKEYKEFSELSPYKKSKFLLEKAKLIEKGSYEDLQSLSNQLFELENTRQEYQNEIEDELKFIEELSQREFESDIDLLDQITDERKKIQEAIKSNDSIIEQLKNKIDWFKDLLSSFTDAIDNIFDFLEQETTPQTTPIEIESNINELESKISDKQAENKELQNEINRFKKLESFLKPLKKKREQQEKLRKRKEILEELKKQSEDLSSNEPPVNSNVEFKRVKDEGSAKKDISVLTSSTTSGGMDYEKFLKDPTNNYAAARFVYFTNTVNPIGMKLLAITAQNVQAIKDKYNVDLSAILFESSTSKKENDVKFVVVRETSTGLEFIDMNGEVILSPSQDNVVYTSLSKSETLLTDSNGKLKYNEKELPKDEKEKKAYLDSVQKEFTEFRTSVLNSTEPQLYEITGISRGIPNYDNEKTVDKDTNEVEFDNNINRKPVQGTLIGENESLVGKLVIGKLAKQGEKTTTTKDHNDKDLNIPVGKPVLVSKESAKTQLIDNHLLSEQKQKDVLNILRLLAKKITKASEEDFEKGKKIIDTKLTNYLKSVIYWRNPDVSKQEIPSENQLWISFDSEFGAILNIGNEKFVISTIEENIDTIQGLLSKVWHNVDAAALNKENQKYVEITNVDVKKGTYNETIWDSYEDYLMSEKNPDGSQRDLKDIPLTTNIIKNTPPFNEQGNLKENLTPQYKSKYLIFDRPTFGDKGQVSTKAQEEQKPIEKPKDSSVLNVILSFFPENSPVASVRENLKVKIPFLQNLKNNTTYNYFNEKSLSNVFSFKTIFKDGVIDDFEITVENENSFNNLSEFLLEKGTNIKEYLLLKSDPALYLYIDKIQFLEKEQIKQETPTEKEYLQDPNNFSNASDLFDEEDSDTNNKANRVAKDTSNYQKINLEKAKEWLAKVLPQVSFKDVVGLIDGVAWGQFYKNGIILSDLAEVGTEFHEAFEAVTGMLLTKKQWFSLAEEFKNRKGEFVEYTTGKKVKYSEATQEQIKEELAEEYRNYALSNGKQVFKGQVKKNNLFRRIYSLITNLIFGKPDTIQEVFQKISDAKYANTPVSRWNRPWNVNKSYRIGSIENGIFEIELNQSMAYMFISNLISNNNLSIYDIFENADIIPAELYSQVKTEIERYYTNVNINNVNKKAKMFTVLSTEQLIDNLDNIEFVQSLIKNINKLPDVFQLTYNQLLSEVKNDAQFASQFQSRIKDAFISYNYINNNWKQVVNNNIDFLKKYKIEIQDVFNEDGSIVVNTEDKTSRDEYTKDAFSVNVKDTANNKIKFLLATLSKRKLVTQNGLVIFDENGLPKTQDVLNRTGLPATLEFGQVFRTVMNVVENSTNILEMMDAIKKASIQNPELVYLYTRLGGNKPLNDFTEDEQRLRDAFNVSMNKFKSNFSRGLLENTEKEGLVTTIVDSLQDQVKKVAKEKWLSNMKALYQNNSPYFKKIGDDIKIVLGNLSALAESKTLEDKVKLTKTLGITLDFEISTLSKNEKDTLDSILLGIKNILLNYNAATILAGERVDFNASLDALAEFQYKITSRTTETNHYNIDKEVQNNIIGLSFFNSLIKDIRSSKTLGELLQKNPHLRDIYHQGSYVLNNLLFNKNNKNRTATPIDIIPVEGLVNTETQDGQHSSDLSYAKKILYEFNNNLRGLFYVLTPADVKTEYALTYWGNIPSKEKHFIQQDLTRNYKYMFNEVFKKYLISEIEQAKDIKENPEKRDLSEYEKQVITNKSGIRKKGESLRIFDSILSFDYSNVIDNPEIDIAEWINSNENLIIKDIENFIESINKETLEDFLDNQLISVINKDYYTLKGIEIDYLKDNQLNQNKVEKQDVLDMINYRNVNYLINVFEQFHLFLGDPAQSNDPFKRIKSFITSKESTTYDTELTKGEVFDNFANKNYNNATFENDITKEEVELPEDAPGFRNFDSTFTGTTVKDVEIVDKSIENIVSSHKERESQELFYKPFNDLTDFLKDYVVKNVISPLKKVYENINEADGQAYMTLPLYREFLKRSDKWNNDLESLYQYDLAFERSEVYDYPDTEQGNKLKEIDKKIIDKGNPNSQRILEGKEPISYYVIKPIGAGIKAGELSIRNLDKMSVMPLSYRLLKQQGAKGLKVYNNAIKQKSDYIRFESAQKEGKPKELTKLYNEKGELTDTFASKDILSFKHFAIQVETSGFKNKIARGTQLTKLAVINLMSAGIPIDFIKSISSTLVTPDSSNVTNKKELKEYLKKLNQFNKELLKEASSQWYNLSEEERNAISPVYKAVSEHTNILNSLTTVYQKELYKELGAKETETGVEISNYEILEKLIKSELEDRGTPKELIKGIRLKDGKFELPFDFLPNGFKVQPLLMSLIDSRIGRPKLNGKSLAQVSSTMFEKHNRDLVYLKDGVWTKVDDYNKLSEEDKQSVKITSNDLAFYESEGKQYIDVYLPAIYKDVLGNFITETGEIDPELLKAVGFRIPSQEINSIENIRIKGFLPVEYGNAIIVPSSITGKAGSDFDIDKLNIYLFNYFLNKQGRPEKIKYLDNLNSTVEERYREYVKSKTFDVLDEVKDEESFKEIKENYFKPIYDKINKVISKEVDKSEKSIATKKAFEEFKKVVKTVKNFEVRKNIFDIISNKEDDIYERQETLNQYLTNTNSQDISVLSLEDKKAISNLLLQYGEYISLNYRTNDLRNFLKAVIKDTKGYEEFRKEFKEALKESFADYIITNKLGTPSFEEFSELSIDLQNSKKALENKYIDTLITILELPENYTRLTQPNSSRNIQQGAKNIDMLNMWADLRNEGKTEEEIEQIIEEKEKEEKQKIKPLDITSWTNPVKNAKTRYAFQVGKKGVGIGAVGITNHAVNQLVNSLGVGFDATTIYFTTNPTEVIDINGERKTVTSLSFTRDSNGEWISNNISEFITSFVDVAKDPFIIRINGNSNTAGSYIIANKLGMSLEDTILLFNQPIVREYEKLEALRSKDLNPKWSKESVLIETLNKYGKPGYINYIDGNFVPVLSALKKERLDVFETEELEEFIKNKYNPNEQRVEQTILLATYLEIKNGSNSLLKAVSEYNWDTANITDNLQVIVKNKENEEYAKDNSNNVPKVIINTQDLFFNKVKQSYIDFTKMFKEIFLSMNDEVFQKLVYPEIDKIFKSNLSQNDKFKMVTAVQKEIINYLLLTTPVNVFNKNIKIGDFVKELLVQKDISPAKILKDLQEKITKGELNTYYGIQELFPTFSGYGQRKTNNIRLLNKQKDPDFANVITQSWEEAINSSNQELSSFVKNLYLLSLVQSGVNQSRVSISQFLPSQFMIDLANQIKTALNTKQIDFTKFRPLLYANKWNNGSFTKRLSKTQVAYLDKDSGMYVSRIYYDKNLPIKTNTWKSNVVEYLIKDGVIQYGKVSTFHLNDFQVSYTSLATDPETNKPYEYSRIKELKQKGINPFKTRIFQRVEKDGKPVFVKLTTGENSGKLTLIYREVSLKGDGQYALEYSQNSVLHENIPYETDEEILTNLKNAGIDYLVNIPDFNEQDPRTQQAEEVIQKTLNSEKLSLPSQQPIVEKTKENFNNLSEYTNEEKKKILATFASKHGLSEQEALLDINKGLNEDKQGTIDNLNECF